MKILRNLSFWTGLLLLAYSTLFFWKSWSMKYYSSVGPGPGFFPRWLNGILIVLSVWYLVDTLRKEQVNVFDVLPRGKQLLKVIRYPAMILLFILMAPHAGFIVTSTIVMVVLLIDHMRWFWSLGISVLTSLALFLAFKHLLGVPLPVNAFGW